MRIRNFVSLMVVGSFSVLAATGMLIFFGVTSKSTEMLHSVFGFVFLLSVVPHLFNNFRALRSYFTKAAKKNA